MEFKHVFILDHGWKNSDMEEERRLYYVGMTRAMKHLTIFAVQDSGNPHTAALARHPFVCCRQAHDAVITGFSTGNRIFLEQDGTYIRILNPERQWVGCLSRKGVEKWKPSLPGIITAQVLGVVLRHAGEDNSSLKTENNIEQWYLPIVEILHWTRQGS